MGKEPLVTPFELLGTDQLDSASETIGHCDISYTRNSCGKPEKCVLNWKIS